MENTRYWLLRVAYAVDAVALRRDLFAERGFIRRVGGWWSAPGELLWVLPWQRRATLPEASPPPSKPASNECWVLSVSGCKAQAPCLYAGNLTPGLLRDPPRPRPWQYHGSASPLPNAASSPLRDGFPRALHNKPRACRFQGFGVCFPENWSMADRADFSGLKTTASCSEGPRIGFDAPLSSSWNSQ